MEPVIDVEAVPANVLNAKFDELFDISLLHTGKYLLKDGHNTMFEQHKGAVLEDSTRYVFPHSLGEVRRRSPSPHPQVAANQETPKPVSFAADIFETEFDHLFVTAVQDKEEKYFKAGSVIMENRTTEQMKAKILLDGRLGSSIDCLEMIDSYNNLDHLHHLNTHTDLVPSVNRSSGLPADKFKIAGSFKESEMVESWRREQNRSFGKGEKIPGRRTLGQVHVGDTAKGNIDNGENIGTSGIDQLTHSERRHKRKQRLKDGVTDNTHIILEAQQSKRKTVADTKPDTAIDLAISKDADTRHLGLFDNLTCHSRHSSRMNSISIEDFNSENEKKHSSSSENLQCAPQRKSHSNLIFQKKGKTKCDLEGNSKFILEKKLHINRVLEKGDDSKLKAERVEHVDSVMEKRDKTKSEQEKKDNLHFVLDKRGNIEDVNCILEKDKHTSCEIRISGNLKPNLRKSFMKFQNHSMETIEKERQRIHKRKRQIYHSGSDFSDIPIKSSKLSELTSRRRSISDISKEVIANNLGNDKGSDNVTNEVAIDAKSKSIDRRFDEALNDTTEQCKSKETVSDTVSLEPAVTFNGKESKGATSKCTSLEPAMSINGNISKGTTSHSTSLKPAVTFNGKESKDTTSKCTSLEPTDSFNGRISKVNKNSGSFKRSNSCGSNKRSQTRHLQNRSNFICEVNKKNERRKDITDMSGSGSWPEGDRDSKQVIIEKVHKTIAKIDEKSRSKLPYSISDKCEVSDDTTDVDLDKLETIFPLHTIVRNNERKAKQLHFLERGVLMRRHSSGAIWDSVVSKYLQMH